jgi:hypothetical protein
MAAATSRVRARLGRGTAYFAATAALIVVPVMVMTDTNRYIKNFFRPQLIDMKVRLAGGTH